MIKNAKNDLMTMSLIHKRLSEISEESSKRIIADLQEFYKHDYPDFCEAIKAMTYVLSKLEKMDKRNGQAVINFMADRYFLVEACKEMVENLQTETRAISPKKHVEDFNPFNEIDKDGV